MVVASSLQLSNCLGISNKYGYAKQTKCTTGNGQLHFFSSNELDAWSLYLLSRLKVPSNPISSKCKGFLCQAVLLPNGGNNISAVQNATLVLKRAFNSASRSSAVFKLVPAICMIAFAVWGLKPLVRLSRNIFLQKSDRSWKKSSIYYITTSYVQPLLLWTGTMLICRALEPMALPVEANHAVNQQLIHFIQSLSTVMAFACCLSSLIEQIRKSSTETSDSIGARNFVWKAVYTAVWVAAISLCMELLGFSTQKWLTAGGLGTVLLTLAGREIFTNFLSSVMIHATRPFVLNDLIQTNIDGCEVSGTVEHVGCWSPTIIRGDDREAVHIPNHKFTVNVVRNQSQKSHRRIKSHFAISHLDVNMINNIVTDMRKVVGKNPQVEQQRLHRRVFLDYVDPDSQALVILVSCFVKTSHGEEYQSVKEAVLLDLLRVISHHRARLATPIRTIQRTYSGAESADADGASFPGFHDPARRPLSVIDSSYKISTQNKKAKSPRRSAHGNEADKEINTETGSPKTSNSITRNERKQGDQETRGW